MKKILVLVCTFILILTGCGSPQIGDEATLEDFQANENWFKTEENDSHTSYEYANPTNGVSLIVKYYDEDSDDLELIIDNKDIYKDNLSFILSNDGVNLIKIKPSKGKSYYANLTDKELNDINSGYREEDAYKSIDFSRSDFDVEKFLKDQNMYDEYINAVNFIGYKDFSFNLFY